MGTVRTVLETFQKLPLKLSLAMHNRWNRRYILSLICCALIPMCVIIGFYLSRTRESLKTQALASGRQAVADLQNTNSGVWDTISFVTVTLNNHPTILKYIQSEGTDLLLAQDVQNVLTSILSTCSMIDDIFLYCDDDRPVCSSRIVFPKEDTRISPSLDGKSFGAVLEDFPLNTAVVARYQGVDYRQEEKTSYDVLLFSCNGFYKSANLHSARILFSIRLDTILGNASGTDEDGISGVALVNRRGSVLGLSRQDSERLELALSEVTPGKEDGYARLRTEWGDYMLFYADETYSLYRALLLCPYESLTVPGNNVLFRLVLLFFGVAISMVVLMVLIHFYNYSPLKNLEDSCRDLQYSTRSMKAMPHAGEKTPFDTINETIQVLQSQNVFLKSVIDDQQEIVRNEKILSMLNIESSPVRERDGMQEDSIVFPCDAFAVFYTRTEFPTEQLRSESSQFFSAQNFYSHGANTNDYNILLVNFPKEELPNISFYMNDFQRELIEKYDTELIIGFSAAACDCSVLPELYAQAKLAYEYHFLLGKALISYEDIQKNLAENIPQLQYDQKCQKLEEAICSGDLRGVKEQLRQLHRLILDHSNALTCRHFCYNLVFFVVHILNGCSRINQELNYDEFFQIGTIDGLFERIYLLCESALTGQDKSRPRPSIKEINQNIMERYGDPLFSIGTLAEHYNMSSSTFSQYYKRKTGITISKYLMQYRLEQAIHFLLDSDIQIDQIVKKVGYFSTSSFIKKFREQYGQTPVEYRLSHRRENRPKTQNLT